MVSNLTLAAALTLIAEAQAEAAYHLAACGEAEARAERAEAIVHDLIREAPARVDVRRLFAGETTKARTVTTPPIPAAPAPEEWAFGPWVVAKQGDPIPEGNYQWGLDGRHYGPFNSADASSRSFYLVDSYRRAYRIGEWHDHDGMLGNPLADDVKVEWENALGDTASCFAKELAWESYGHPIKRFRPLGAA